jgi:hypothetical protein
MLFRFQFHFAQLDSAHCGLFRAVLPVWSPPRALMHPNAITPHPLTARIPASSRFAGRIPKSLKDLTPGQHFDPRSFFHEMVWKPLKTRRTGTTKLTNFPSLRGEQLALTWIGHASFLIQFSGPERPYRSELRQLALFF